MIQSMKAAVLCAGGLGDGLLMMISACQLRKKKYEVTVYHPHFQDLAPLFPDYTFHPYPEIADFQNTFNRYDLLILENDNSERAWTLFRLRDEGKMRNLRCFFPTPCIAYKQGDIVFNKHFPVATNIATATQFLLNLTEPERDNDIRIPPSRTHRKNINRVLIHPTSKDPKRNWKVKQFLKLARWLKKEGFTVAFSVGPDEREEWKFIEKEGFILPQNNSFSELAAYIFESGYLIGNDSGLGHLASNLGIPTLTISGNRKRVKLWRPNWTFGEIVTPKYQLPNWKGIGFRFREWAWQYFVSVKRVWKQFHLLTTHEH